ncbi:MAG: hypothetical protein LZF86_100052 [Nitrospira sp.]|nr:MAG: hypothetical protein LZF86_100052 [Nitrospira sp.]
MDCPLKSSHLDVPPSIELNVDRFMIASLFSHEGITGQLPACYSAVNNPAASRFSIYGSIPTGGVLGQKKLTHC